jgi:phosphatidylserine/phosphatidylglycerophosphate/cardiolipin synthase-like enzyme
MFTSQLHDESTFYQTFLSDLERCQKELVIESPYITCERMKTFDRFFEKLIKKGVKIYFITRDPKEHDENLEFQSEEVISHCERIGIQVLLCLGNHHRKLAILDRKILWEGSLNILSQTYSREIMRRIENRNLALEMFNFLKLGEFL